MARPVTLEPTTPFGAALRVAREATGMSQSRLAALSGIDPSRINKLESGREADLPREAAILALAAALGRDPTPLLIAAGRLPADLRDRLLDAPAWAGYIRAHPEPPTA